MSLINDMLRDIDQRGAQPPGEHHAVFDETMVVPPPRTQRWPPSWAMLLSVGAILCSLAFWLLYNPDSNLGKPVPEPARLAAALLETEFPPIAPAPTAQAQTHEPGDPERAPTTPSTPEAGAEQTTPAHESPSFPAETPPAATATASTQPRPEPAPRIANANANAGQPVYILPGKLVSLRTGPALSATVLHVLSARSPLALIDRADGFLEVRTQAGITGWINAKFAQVGGTPPAPPATEPAPAPPALAERPIAATPTVPAPHPAPPLEKSARALHTEALRALERGQTTTAETRLLDALRADPRHAPALNTLSALMLQQDRRAELEARLADSVRQNPPNPPAATLLARLLAENGNLAAALEQLENLPPDSLDGEQLTVLAALRQRAGRHQGAADAYRRALALGQRNGAAWAGLAASLDHLGNTAQARQAWQSALDAGPLDAALERHARARLAALDGPGE